jgi:hypothetical protein
MNAKRVNTVIGSLSLFVTEIRREYTHTPVLNTLGFCWQHG